MTIIYIVKKGDFVSPMYIVDYHQNWREMKASKRMTETEILPDFLYTRYYNTMHRFFGDNLVAVSNVPASVLSALEASERQLEVTEMLSDMCGIEVVIIDQETKRTTTTYEG